MEETYFMTFCVEAVLLSSKVEKIYKLSLIPAQKPFSGNHIQPWYLTESLWVNNEINKILELYNYHNEVSVF